MKKIVFNTAALLSVITASYAQTLDVDVELRPRYEYDHGAGSLVGEHSDPANYVTQRSRLNVGYSQNNLKVYFSLQDVRTWGEETSSLSNNSVNDNEMTGIHQAWASVGLGKNLALKVGRQELVYDDERMLGAVNWSQQARAFDAGVFQMRFNKGWKIDLGGAFNQTNTVDGDGSYYDGDDFKTMQYMWMHKDFGTAGLSLLAMNTGWQDADGTSGTQNRQTYGMHLSQNTGQLKLGANAYYQMGEDLLTRDISAFLVSLDAAFDLSNHVYMSAGFEYLSGTDYDETEKNNTFSPLFGTNHKFNGNMDYFYVGPNSGNPTGLIDIYGKLGFKANKFFIDGTVHNFTSPAEYAPDASSNLGIEMDINAGYKYSESVNFQLGYDQMFAGKGLEELDGVSDPAQFNNAIYFMLIIKPKVVSSKKLNF